MTARTQYPCFLLAAVASGLAALSAGAAPPASSPTEADARRAAQAVLQMIPGDDIEHSFRPLAVRVADLDRDGVPEIVHFYSSTYTGGSFEQSSELVVMTRLGKDDRRGINPHPGNTIDDQDYAAIRAAGYGQDASVHIPGEFRRLVVDGQQIKVTFQARDGSTYCHAKARATRGEPCPVAGEHTWAWRWTPGKLVRVSPAPSV